jgi:hypothetical protein
MTKTKMLQQRLDEQRRRADVDNFDVTVRELVRMAAKGEIDRAPAYQRKFRWGEEEESRLIESLLLGLPVPSLFVATNPNGTWEIVDGLQRLSTIIGKRRLMHLTRAYPIASEQVKSNQCRYSVAHHTVPEKAELQYARM